MSQPNGPLKLQSLPKLEMELFLSIQKVLNLSDENPRCSAGSGEQF
jgi:hypothetical protein